MACFGSVLNAARTSVLKADASIVNCLLRASKLAASLCALTLFWQQMEDIFVYIVFFLVAIGGGGGSDKSKQIDLKQTNKQTRQNPKEKEIQSKLELHSSQMSLPLSQWSSGIAWSRLSL